MRSDVKLKTKDAGNRTTLSAQDLAKILGIRDDVFPIEANPPGSTRSLKLTYEEMGHAARQIFSGSLYMPAPLLIASKKDGSANQLWMGLSFDGQNRRFVEAVLTPPVAKYDYWWTPNRELGSGRWVVRSWTDDSGTTNDPGDLRFKARIVLEVK